MEDWLPAQHFSTGWRKRVERMLDRHLLPAFGAVRLDRIGRPTVERWFDAVSRKAPGVANMTLALLRKIMTAAKAAGHVGTDPVAGVRPNPRRKKTRFLSGEEITRLHRTRDRLVEKRPSCLPQADIIRLLLLTGCRKSEILMLRWSEVDGDVLRLAEAKTGSRTVRLSEAAQAVIARQPRNGSAWVFPSPGDPERPQSRNFGFWPRARREAGIEDVRLHDLRHTVASQAVARGVPLPTVARMLGYTQPTMTLSNGTTGSACGAGSRSRRRWSTTSAGGSRRCSGGRRNIGRWKACSGRSIQSSGDGLATSATASGPNASCPLWTGKWATGSGCGCGASTSVPPRGSGPRYGVGPAGFIPAPGSGPRAALSNTAWPMFRSGASSSNG